MHSTSRRVAYRRRRIPARLSVALVILGVAIAVGPDSANWVDAGSEQLRSGVNAIVAGEPVEAASNSRKPRESGPKRSRPTTTTSTTAVPATTTTTAPTTTTIPAGPTPATTSTTIVTSIAPVTTTTTLAPATTVAVTAPTTSAAPRAEVASFGVWLSPPELLALPTSGAAWDEVLVAANAFTASMTDYTNQDSTHGTHALAAALVAARTGNTDRGAAVVEAIRAIASRPYDTTSNPSALGWARSMTAWVIAGDLVGLEQYDPELDGRWRQFLAAMPQYPYPGDGGNNLLDLSINRANNIGAVARAAVTAIAIYTGDADLLRLMADLYRAWLEGSDVYRFDWAADKDRSWQCHPGDPATYRGINPADCVRDGNDLGGVLPDEFRRSGPYDPTNYPGPNTTKYPWEALGAAIAQADLLARAGYPDALEWGDQAPRRALERLWYLHSIAADDGWTFGRAAGGGSDDRWIIPLVNSLYATAFPEPGATGHGRPVSWTNWTHLR